MLAESQQTPKEIHSIVGLSEQTIHAISNLKNEPEWLRSFRQTALQEFNKQSLPSWAPTILNQIPFDQLSYYLPPASTGSSDWCKVEPKIRKTFDQLGIQQHEKSALGGLKAQFDSEAAYSNIKEKLRQKGVIFVDSAEGLIQHEALFRPFFAKTVPIADNKFSALNSTVFSGGSFIYIPPGVKLTQPLQAYFRINAERSGQFERTLIIADKDSELTYIEGCTAPANNQMNLHAAVVEVVALEGAKIQYITLQNWSNHVLNLVTKRARVHANAQVRWIDCNIGAALTMKYPCLLLQGPQAKGEMISISVANTKQYQDTGAKIFHLADNTSSTILSKSIVFGTGKNNFRAQVGFKNSNNSRNRTECHSLILGKGTSNTYPDLNAQGKNNILQMEADVSRIDQEQLFYLRQRGLKEQESISLSVNGFINDLVRAFPLEYGIELKRLLELEMERSIG